MHVLTVLLLFLAAVSLASCAAPNDAPSSPTPQTRPIPRRVLFIGNSYTYVNDMPDVVSRLAAACDPPMTVETDRYTKGGYSFARHWTDGGAVEKIREGGWDVVVLQDKSTGPVNQPGPASMKKHAHLLHEEIDQIGARTVFYMTWARQHIPEMIEPLAKHYNEIADELGAGVAPVGRAWQAALAERPDLILLVKDSSHPNQLGSYLAACVFHATLTVRDPRGLPNAGLDEVSDADAAFLQKIAWQAVQEHGKSPWTK